VLTGDIIVEVVDHSCLLIVFRVSTFSTPPNQTTLFWKRAIVHAHAIRHSKVELETWTEDDTDTTFFRVTDEVNDEIMDSLAQLF
jgi:hypothetical protein